jgi:hypothetical protein
MRALRKKSSPNRPIPGNRIEALIAVDESSVVRCALSTSDELLSEDVMSIIGAMSERYAERLGLETTKIIDGPRKRVKVRAGR